MFARIVGAFWEVNMITLYTLPNCGICQMVKTKLKSKNLSFVEEKFEDIAEVIQSNQAPALQVINDEGKTIIYNSPMQIVAWINQQ